MDKEVKDPIMKDPLKTPRTARKRIAKTDMMHALGVPPLNSASKYLKTFVTLK
jgi:hypothetical protein